MLLEKLKKEFKELTWIDGVKFITMAVLVFCWVKIFMFIYGTSLLTVTIASNLLIQKNVTYLVQPTEMMLRNQYYYLIFGFISLGLCLSFSKYFRRKIVEKNKTKPGDLNA